ncbi:Predicted amino acid racemase [Tenacibaculum sp. MAR_2009_124]|uniref:alanine/ornithine racemase family PLP-dependent enzyme n=1 Tax=Tenacibaculum sp. MAR_2009_124 TaxID=1250059 RepID=UPI000898DECC|nr:alanine/ornithine racemase family PLP-dependent enzyme [Tenacibaculum sp. MAR_2009_124]SEB51793.1 Predicted amino acid racemase [Tenacibaculum sp. MAR_2009_124]
MRTPRIDIDIRKIAFNTKQLKKIYGAKGIQIIGVTKLVQGNPVIASVLVDNGIEILADSRIENIIRMIKGGVQAEYLLLRTPSLSQVEEIVTYANISLNSELSILRELSKYALIRRITHKVILMLELGDLREGIMPLDIDSTVKEVLDLKGIDFIGIGSNFACYGGISPDIDKMNELSSIAIRLEKKFKITLTIISGGNSANYNWFKSSKSIGRINNLRLGESIFLGRESLCREKIPTLFTDAFTLVAEIIETKIKPSKPYGKVYKNANGQIEKFKDMGLINRGILAIGRQDVPVLGIIPRENILILGASSDHIVIDNTKSNLKVGDTIEFSLRYMALLRALNSSYITKNIII